MENEIVLGLILFVSVVANVILFRLASWQSRDLAIVSDGLGDLTEVITNYRKHLKSVYELDAFYGDETLKFLMEHTNALVNILEEQYGEVTSITDPIEYEIKDVEEKDAEEESTQKEKHVLYAGTRRRNS